MKLKNKIAAFSLMEALITVLVISIGLLGYASLQITALNSSLDTFSRTQAVTILEDAASRIRNNRSYIYSDTPLPNAYSNDSAGFYTWCDIEKSSIPIATCTGSNNCTSAVLAKNDVFEVCDSLVQTKLPTAIIGSKCFDRDTSDSDSCSIGSRMSIYMAWKGQERKDVSGKNDYAQNTRCQSEIDLAGNYACVQLELVP